MERRAGDAFVSASSRAEGGALLVRLQRFVATHRFWAGLLATVAVFSIPLWTIAELADQRTKSAVAALGVRQTGLQILQLERAADRRLRVLRADAIVRHSVRLGDRSEFERSLLRLSDAVGAAPRLQLGAHLSAVQGAWSKVPERGALASVDATLASLSDFETAVVERAGLTSASSEITADSIAIYTGALPVIDDRIDQECNLLIAAFTGKHIPSGTAVAVEIFADQYRRAYGTAIAAGERLRAEGDDDVLGALRRLGAAQSRFDAAARYVLSRRSHYARYAGLIESRASDVRRTVDAVGDLTVRDARLGLQRQIEDEHTALTHTLNLTLSAWLLGVALTLLTAFTLVRRERLVRQRERERDAARLRAAERDYGDAIERLAVTEAQLEAIFAHSSLGVAILDRTGRIVRHNPSLEALVERLEPASVGAGDERFAALIRGTSDGYSAEIGRERGGRMRWLQSDCSLIRDAQGTPHLVLAIVRDVTDRREAERRLRFEATHDPISRLPNRAYLFERMRALYFDGAAPPGLAALAYLELDTSGRNEALTKSSNEAFAAAAARLAAAVEPNDFLARYDGNAFVVLLDGQPDRAAIARSVEKLQRRIGEPVSLGDCELYVQATAGVVIADRPYREPAEMIRDAEIAMHDARSRRGALFAIFTPEMHDRAQRRALLASHLRRAIDNDQLHLVFQPLIAAPSARLRGFEALLRWDHPDLGPVSPTEFIPLAEDSGAIGPIGRWVLDRACAQLASWRAQALGPDDLTIAVNASVAEVLAHDYAPYVRRTLARHALAPRDLVLEVTESAVLFSDRYASGSLERLKAVGIGLAIDDFGTGYSSLRYLHEFPFDQLKIDGSFVCGEDGRLANEPIVTMLVALGKSAGVEVVAEGVETSEQAAQLKRLGVETVQGFFFGKPLPASLVPDFLRLKRLPFAAAG